jgi:hypothetical protein
MKISLLPAALLTLSLSAGAAPQMCFDQAGKDYQIDPLLLMSISIKESRLRTGCDKWIKQEWDRRCLRDAGEQFSLR